MAPDWKLGKVEEVNVGRDGLVRGATIAYKNVQEGQDDRKFMVVKRPIRQIVKLFNVDDTSLIGDLIQTQQLVKKILDSKLTSKAEDLTKTTLSGPDASPILDIKEDANHTRNKVGLIEMKTNMFAAINLPCNSSMYTSTSSIASSSSPNTMNLNTFTSIHPSLDRLNSREFVGEMRPNEDNNVTHILL